MRDVTKWLSEVHILWEKKLGKILDKDIEPSQQILVLKSTVCNKFADKLDDCYTFRHEDKFGFSERLVNRLM